MKYAEPFVEEIDGASVINWNRPMPLEIEVQLETRVRGQLCLEINLPLHQDTMLRGNLPSSMMLSVEEDLFRADVVETLRTKRGSDDVHGL